MPKFGVGRLTFYLWAFVAVFLSDSATASVTFESAFTGTQSFTDNLFFDDQNKKSDFGTFFGPNLTLRYDDPDIVIGATYLGRVALYLKNTGANRYNQNANIILDLPFLTKQNKNLTVTFEENMNFTPQLDAFAFSGAQDALNTFGREPDPSQTGTQGGGGTQVGSTQGGGGSQGVFTTRASSFFNRAGVTLGYTWLPRLSGSFRYSNQYLHFFSKGFQDSLTHSGTFSLNFGVTERTAVAPFYTYRQTDFIGTSDNDTTGDKTISHIPELQINHAFTPLLSANLRSGVAFTKQIGAEESVSGGGQRDLSNAWQTNYVGSVQILKLYGLGSISLTAQQTIGSGGGLVSQATRIRIFTGRIQHSLSPRLQGFASIGYSQNTSLEANAIDTDTYQIQSGILYAFRSWLSGNIFYMHINQSSKGGAAENLQVNQVFLGLTAVADPWVLFR